MLISKCCGGSVDVGCSHYRSNYYFRCMRCGKECDPSCVEAIIKEIAAATVENARLLAKLITAQSELSARTTDLRSVIVHRDSLAEELSRLKSSLSIT